METYIIAFLRDRSLCAVKALYAVDLQRATEQANELRRKLADSTCVEIWHEGKLVYSGPPCEDPECHGSERISERSRAKLAGLLANIADRDK
jgi:hypothetical protein